MSGLAANVPEGLKNITPFLQRAAQLQERDPIVSYYANYYAAKLAIGKASKDNRDFVEALLNTLEKQRKDIGENEAISSDLVGYAHIENFAIKIFSRADDEDRAGQGSQKTAKNFVAAANFLELLKVFGDIDSEVEEKIKYAKWRAADIVKAIRDGRQPAPPPGAQKSSASELGLDTTMESLDTAAEATNAAAAGAPATFPSEAMDTTGGYVNATTYSPAVVAPSFPTSDMSGVSGGAAPSFPTIANFPSPPLGHSSPANSSNGAQGANNWNQTPSPHVAPSSTFIPPASNIPSIQSPPAPAAQQPFINNAVGGYAASGPVNPAPQTHFGQQPPTHFGSPSAPYGQQPPPPQQPPQQPYYQPQVPPTPPAPTPVQQYQAPYNPMPVQVLDPAVSAQVQKHCKWTISSLTYDDIPAAVDNLEKALALLRPYHSKN
ncbi:vacuolar protein sorting-associated protein VTA1 [Entomortierella parvispora]|uniref:Vacuolar protein sorting-associated protein VTA1 n=1 Tax=Entomortierella parvispora TaxID=205924 RepID=A0A9P3HD21_9FUNG|nr:vacuolar protein sorting-associated protein VTA1 [Entomortierella parvispora]